MGSDWVLYCVVLVDRARTKAFPATAQVASQQGEYIAKRLNGLARQAADTTDAPFNYRHLGQLAYIGGESAAVDLGGGRSISGWGAYWLWKGVRPHTTYRIPHTTYHIQHTAYHIPHNTHHISYITNHISHTHTALSDPPLTVCCSARLCQVYFSTSVSTRTRALLLSNWIRTQLFGRDVSKQ